MFKITSFGEVLWDNLPTGKVLGGAPVNLLTHLATLGADCSVISCCGNKARVVQSDVFVFGSLAVRDAVSRQALAELLPYAAFKIFDVNLHLPHYQFSHLRDMMQQANFIKFNDDELYEIAAEMGSPYLSMEQNLHFIAERTHTRQICVTLGKHGALYFCDGELFAHHGYRVNVADTVGAGDSFLAGFIHQFLQGKTPPETLAFACALGSLVASRHGATPEITLAEIDALMYPR